MDIEMPNMDGLEAAACNRKKRAGRDRPFVVALTANAIAGDRKNYLRSGVEDCVSKPMEQSELVCALRASWSFRQDAQAGQEERTG
jgi:CheY-like chemotaxis protein